MKNIYVTNAKTLSSEEEKTLIKNYRESIHDNVRREAKNQLILCNMPLIYSVINKTTKDSTIKEELVSYGVEGIIDAMDRYDVNSEARFSTYAYNWIFKRVKEGYRKASWSFDIPEEVYSGYVRFCKEFEAFATKYGHEPSYYASKVNESEMMSILCHDQDNPMSFSLYQRVVSAYQSKYISSFDQPIGNENNGDTVITLGDTIEDKKQDGFDNQYLYQAIEHMKTDLKEGDLVSKIIYMKAQGLMGSTIQEKLNIQSRSIYRRLENVGKEYLLNDTNLRAMYNC